MTQLQGVCSKSVGGVRRAHAPFPAARRRAYSSLQLKLNTPNGKKIKTVFLRKSTRQRVAPPCFQMSGKSTRLRNQRASGRCIPKLQNSGENRTNLALRDPRSKLMYERRSSLRKGQSILYRKHTRILPTEFGFCWRYCYCLPAMARAKRPPRPARQNPPRRLSFPPPHPWRRLSVSICWPFPASRSIVTAQSGSAGAASCGAPWTATMTVWPTSKNCGWMVCPGDAAKTTVSPGTRTWTPPAASRPIPGSILAWVRWVTWMATATGTPPFSA